MPWVINPKGAEPPAPRKPELRQGARYLETLVKRLPELRVVVAQGNEAQEVVDEADIGDVQVTRTVHPSPRNVNQRERYPEEREWIAPLRRVAALAAEGDER